MTDVSYWRQILQPPAGSKGVWGQSPQRLAIFTIFYKNTFLGIFRLFLLKNTFLISSITVYKTVNDLETEHFSCNKNT